MYALPILGAVLLAAVALYYGSAAIMEGIRGQSPPGIVHLGYLALTAFGFIAGFQLVFADPVRSSFFQTLANVVISPGTHLNFFLIFTWTAFILVIINLMRSYFNLHDIENIKRESRLGRTIRRLEHRRHGLRWIEFGLRIGMFTAIVLLNKLVIELTAWQNSAQTSDSHDVSFFGAGLSFEEAFKAFWATALAFYAILLIWDFLVHSNAIWLTNQEGSSQALTDDASATRNIMKTRAFPVHLLGAGASLFMTISVHNSDDSVIYTAFAAGLLGLLGVCVFIWGMVKDYERVKLTLKGEG